MIGKFTTWLAGNNIREMIARIITCGCLAYVIFMVLVFLWTFRLSYFNVPQ